MNKSLIYSKFPDGKIDYDKLKNTVVSFRVFYDDLSYTKISQQPQISLNILISNIGGLLGLFLGVSFLTMVEILESFLEIIYVFSDINNQTF